MYLEHRFRDLSVPGGEIYGVLSWNKSGTVVILIL